MTPDQINTAIAELCGWEQKRIDYRDTSSVPITEYDKLMWCHPRNGVWPSCPKYTNSRDACSEFESTITSTADRVKWLNTMREIVSRRCPRNKIGAPLVSDFDIAMSTAMERCECWLNMKGRWENL